MVTVGQRFNLVDGLLSPDHERGSSITLRRRRGWAWVRDEGDAAVWRAATDERASRSDSGYDWLRR
jgi:hypothetical protein